MSGVGQLRVRDRNGTLTIRADGVLLDGDSVDLVGDGKQVRVPMMLVDNKPADGIAVTLATARRILGDQFAEADYRGLTDTMARHTVVRKRLGTVANGRPSQFLDAAWNTLAASHGGSAPAVDMPVLTDAQKAFAADAVKRAMADRAGGAAMVQDFARGAADGAKVFRDRKMTDAWKSDRRRKEEALLDGASYSERMGIRQGTTSHGMCKASEQKLSDDEYYSRQREYRALQGSAA